MGKVFVEGLVLIVAGIVVVALDQLLNLGLGSILFGLAIGGVLGLVSQADGGPVGRMLGFILGIVVAMVGFILQALVLNGSFVGQVLTVAVLLGLITIVCALTAGRVPLWSALLGLALITGAYGSYFAAAPQNILTEMFQYTTVALVPAAFGFLAGVFVAPQVKKTQLDEKVEEMAAPSGATSTKSEV